MISFFVPGIPAPQGSKRAFVVNGKARLVESSKACKPWRDSVRAAALEAKARPHTSALIDFDGPPISLRITFVLPRPRAVPIQRRGWPASRPDLDKLLRSTLDGLTGALYRDDAQVVLVVAKKQYVGPHPTPGAWIECKALPCDHVGGANKRGRCVDCGAG